LEVERILACDENEMNMQVLSKQRAVNLKREQAEEDQKEMDSHWNVDKWNLEQLVGEPEAPWDPEDNVRYVVKWKGLPYVDITWEYWRDIKRDAVDEAEDFWYRQRAPDLEEVHQLTNRPHPHIREFHKLKESPSYGLSRRSRPIASLDDNDTTKTVAAASDSDPGFTLRSYQLEGVNWLLFNWWNRRSCILADEMVRCQ
jgi:chromodomain-helicase-DNA-binding protein 7